GECRSRLGPRHSNNRDPCGAAPARERVDRIAVMLFCHQSEDLGGSFLPAARAALSHKNLWNCSNPCAPRGIHALSIASDSNVPSADFMHLRISSSISA